MKELKKEFQKNQAKIDSNKTTKEERKELIERNKEILELMDTENEEKQTNKKIEDLKNELYLGDYGEEIVNYNNGYIGDIITEIADNTVDIYNNDLMEWAKGNTSYIEDALREFGTPEDSNGHPDFMRIIMQGQYYMHEQDLYNNLEDVLKYWAYNYIEDNYNITELTEEQNDEVEFLNYNNFEELEDIKNELQNIFESEAE